VLDLPCCEGFSLVAVGELISVKASLVAPWLRIHLSMQETWVGPRLFPHDAEQLSPYPRSIEPVLLRLGVATTEACIS